MPDVNTIIARRDEVGARMRALVDAMAEVGRIRADLEIATLVERDARGAAGPRCQAAALHRMVTTAESGSRVVGVRLLGGDIIPGVVLRQTPARATVLTEQGEAVFDLRARGAWDQGGLGRGCRRGWTLIGAAALRSEGS